MSSGADAGAEAGRADGPEAATPADRSGARPKRPATPPELPGPPKPSKRPESSDPLGQFCTLTRDWFAASFAEPTAAQAGAWAAIADDAHTLVVAPTGSGKTLAAFLAAIDRLVAAPPPAPGGPPSDPRSDPRRRCSVLYISPLKALAVDVERNLRAPLAGIGALAAARGQRVPEIAVAVRSGDTPSADRRVFSRDGADILITTPESLFLLLTSRAREMLAGVRTVIIDEVHAVAGTKRGAHLAVSLDRLDQLLDRPAQRIGLSATVSPLEEVARFLAGGRPVAVVRPPSTKVLDIDVVVPVQDLAQLGQPTGDLTGAAAGEVERTSIWPHVEERIVDEITAHTSTIVFTNSRRLAERLTARLNEIHAERTADGEQVAVLDPAGIPAQIMAQSGAAAGAPATLAKAHHGSVSKEQRALIEHELKTGVLPAVVATSSLELGIDMGAVDLVIQVEAPPSVASGLQRIGRAGHQVGAPSHGVMFPKFRGDLVSTAVVAERMAAGAIESLSVPSLPLDIAAQQVVAICAMDRTTVDDVLALLRRSAPFATLSRGALESVLDMLSGRYPSEEFAELRPRLNWDRITGELTGRPGAQRLAVTSGGTIPDRGLFGVFLATAEDAAGRAPRRVGELDEEMVYESRVGDVFALGSSSWRIVEITYDRVLVIPAPGLPGRLPFWKGDTLGRPAELGAAHGAFVREVADLAAAAPAAAGERLARAGLDGYAAENLLRYLAEQREAAGILPDEKTIVVERFRDELGDWRVVVHSPYGAAVHAPWSLVLAARMRERFGVDVQAAHADDGIVFRLPDVEYEGGLPDLAELLVLDPETVEAEIAGEIGGSAVFASRFRECAARALLLPRKQIGARQPLWQQRQRAAQLLEVAARYPSFPIVAEAVRECLSDVFDVPALTELMRGVVQRRVQVVEVTTEHPSPFASSLMFGYVAQFLYEGDSPLAERRAAALTVDPVLLAELLGSGAGLALRDLLDPAAVVRTEAELQRLADDRRARNADELADLLRVLGPLDTAEVELRAEPELAVEELLGELERARRVIRVRIAGREQWADPADAAVLRDALGTPLPPGIAAAFTEPVDDPLGRLLGRYARTRGPFIAAEPAARFGLGVAVVTDALRRLASSGRLSEGEFRPPGAPGLAGVAVGEGREFVDAQVLRLLRRRSLAALRAEVEPVPPATLGRFLPAWNGIGATGSARLSGIDGLARAVEQLAGAVLPASALETLILPSRVAGYTPALLDELTTSGEVLWTGHGALAADDCWVSLHLAESAHLTVAPPAPDVDVGGPVHAAILRVLAGGGAYFFRTLADLVTAELPAPAAATTATDDAAAAAPDSGGEPGPTVTTRPAVSEAVLLEALWDLVFAGLVTGDTVAPLRARLAGGRTTHRSRPGTPRRRPQRLSGLAGLAQRTSPPSFVGGQIGQGGQGEPGAQGTQDGPAGPSARARRSGALTVPSAAGRWSLAPVAYPDPTVRAHATAELLLDRYGIVTRGSVVAEDVAGGFAGVYRVLSAFEESGRVRRGYFVEGLGAAQFGTAGAVDRLRAADPQSVPAAVPMPPGPGSARPGAGPGTPASTAIVLAAADPANPYGAALPWPTGSSDLAERHRPARRAGALVVLVDGRLVLFAERGGRSLLSFVGDATGPDAAGPNDSNPNDSNPAADLDLAALALAGLVQQGRLAGLTVGRVDGVEAVTGRGPVLDALTDAGFVMTPRGLRLRRRAG